MIKIYKIMSVLLLYVNIHYYSVIAKCLLFSYHLVSCHRLMFLCTKIKKKGRKILVHFGPFGVVVDKKEGLCCGLVII